MRNVVFGAALALAAGVGIAARPAAAQSPIPLSVEVRGHAAFPRGGDFEQAANTGGGYGVAAAVQLLPGYAVYGGYSRTHFDLEGSGAARATDSGFALGLTRGFTIPGAPVAPWVGTGLLLHRMEVDVAGTRVQEGEGRVGFEVGGGVAVPLAPRLRLTPGIGYRRYDAEFAGDDRARISYFTAGVGLNVAF